MIFFFEHHGMVGKDFYRVNRMLGKSFPAHLHFAYELIFVNAGEIVLQVERTQAVMKRGELAFIFGNQIHSFTALEGADVTVVIFSPELVGDFYQAYKDFVPKSNVLRPRLRPGFEDAESVYAKKGLLYSVCGALLSSAEMEPVTDQGRATLLQNVFAYIDRHFAEKCSLKDLAGELQYDYTYLSRLFNQLAGMRFSEYLNNYRISQACYMLKTGGRTISEISELCGYSSLRTFHRNFLRVMRCSPREYISLP